MRKNIPEVAPSDDAPLDFSALDPSRDTARWDDMVKSVAQRAVAARRRQRAASVPGLALSWSRPWMAAAAVLVMATWGLAAVREHLRASPAAAPETVTAGAVGALQVAQWANDDTSPDAATILSTLDALP